MKIYPSLTTLICMKHNTVLVTGSSSGLGKGIVEALSKYNFAPIITYRNNSEEARRTVATLAMANITSRAFRLDLTSEKSINEFCDTILQEYPVVDTLICNAGVDYYHETPYDVTLNEWREVFEVKLFGHIKLIQCLLPILKKSPNPNIIFISASLADRPDPLDPAYSSVSAATNNYSRSLVYALKDFSIRSNIVCPGPIDTNLSYWKTLKSKNSSIFTSLEAASPSGTLAQPSDVAAAIRAIVDNKMLNGNTFYINAGAHHRP